MSEYTPDQRIVAGVAATLTFCNVDANGDPASAAGAMNVEVKNADGTTVIASTAATADPATLGRYTTPLSASLADLGRLTATWTDAGDSSTHTTEIEVVGGRYLTPTRWRELVVVDETAARNHPTLWVVRALEAELELEWICDRAFVPRWHRETLLGDGERQLDLTVGDLRSVVSVTVDGTALTAGELADLDLSTGATGWVRRDEAWPTGEQVVVTVTHGWTRPPHDLQRALAQHIQFLLAHRTNTITQRATDYTSPDGARWDLDRAGSHSLGLPDVDGVYGRYSRRERSDGSAGAAAGSKPIPASRYWSLDPQRDSLFHGGVR